MAARQPMFRCLHGHWHESENLGGSSRLLDLSRTKSFPDGVQLFHVFERQVRRPPFPVIDQFDLDFGNVLALAYEFDLSTSHHFPLYPAPRKTFPGSFPVIFPPSITGTPLTST